jgi:hypothetical protein
MSHTYMLYLHLSIKVIGVFYKGYNPIMAMYFIANLDGQKAAFDEHAFFAPFAHPKACYDSQYARVKRP